MRATALFCPHQTTEHIMQYTNDEDQTIILELNAEQEAFAACAQELFEDANVTVEELGRFIFQHDHPFDYEVTKPGRFKLTSKLVNSEVYQWIHWMMLAKQAQQSQKTS